MRLLLAPVALMPLFCYAVENTGSASNMFTPQFAKPKYAIQSPTTPQRQIPVIDKSKVDPKLLEAAQGFEALYVDYMFQTMRKTAAREESEFNLDSPTTDIYRGMLDTERAQAIAKGHGVGLSDQVIAYLTARSYNWNRSNQAPKGKSVQEVPHEGK